MKRLTAWSCLMALALVLPAAGHAQTLRGRLGIHQPGLSLSLSYRERPRFVPIEGTRVYTVYGSPFDYDSDDFELYDFDGAYYVCRDGYWYRSYSYDGPFEFVERRYIPVQLVDVRSRGWGRHNLPGRWYGRNYGYGYRAPQVWRGDDRRWRGGDTRTWQGGDRTWQGGDTRTWQRGEDRVPQRGEDRNWQRGDNRGPQGGNRGQEGENRGRGGRGQHRGWDRGDRGGDRGGDHGGDHGRGHDR